MRSVAWAKDNPEMKRERDKKWRANNKENLLKRNRRYRERHRMTIRAMQARYRARKCEANGFDYTTTEHIAGRYAVWGNRCYLCGETAEALDHVIPLARGGSHWPANLRPICKSCNSKKNSIWPYDIEEIREIMGYYGAPEEG